MLFFHFFPTHHRSITATLPQLQWANLTGDGHISSAEVQLLKPKTDTHPLARATRKASLPAAPRLVCCPTSHRCHGQDRDTTGTLAGTCDPRSPYQRDSTVTPRHVETNGYFNSGTSQSSEHFASYV